MLGSSPTTSCAFPAGTVVAVVALLSMVTAGCSGGGSGGGSGTAPTATATRRLTPSAPRPTESATATVAATSTATSVPTVTGTTSATPTTTVTPTMVVHTVLPTATPTVPATATPTVPPATTETPTATPLIGPVVTGFGVADASGTVTDALGRDGESRPIFRVGEADGFILFVEGRPGVSRLPIGTSRFHQDGGVAVQPDVQIVSSNDLGNATAAVCDGAFPVAGGVPAIVPARFDAEPGVTAALNDFACRFKVFSETDFACTQNARGNFVFAAAGSVVQFCTLVNAALTFPTGDTVLTARLRDTDGNAGLPVEIVVRVGGG